MPSIARPLPALWRPGPDGLVRWQLIDLVHWLDEGFGISVSEATLGRQERALGFRERSAWPRA